MVSTISAFCLLFALLLTFHRVESQECRVVSICSDDDQRANAGSNFNTGNTGRRAAKGDRGFPGKAGPIGRQGQVGKKGSQGTKGEPGSTDGIEEFQHDIRNLIAGFNHSLLLLASHLNVANEKIEKLFPPVNCSQSDKDGPQLLSSGERVFCHQRWRVIQRRFNGQVIFHNRTWDEYKNGFGSLSTEFWIGLEHIHRLTSSGSCRLRVELGGFDNDDAFAEYREFAVANESDLFRLHISGYSGGTAGDSIIGEHDVNNMPFSAVDRDNDSSDGQNCAVCCGGGWWHRACGRAKLNGRTGKNVGYQGFTWRTWKKLTVLKSSMMMIRCE